MRPMQFFQLKTEQKYSAAQEHSSKMQQHMEMDLHVSIRVHSLILNVYDFPLQNKKIMEEC